MSDDTLAYKIMNERHFTFQRKTFEDIFHGNKVIIAVIHLLPLPGSPLYKGSLQEILETALHEAKIFQENGVAALCIENFRDYPFYPGAVPPETIAAMAAIAKEVKREVPLTLGINMLRNDAKAALAVATAVDAEFIRVNVHMGVVVSEHGLLSGLSHETLRYRATLKSNALIFADIGVKHATPLVDRGLATEAQEAEYRGIADALIVSGLLTGKETSYDDVAIARQNSQLPLLLGSGTNPENVTRLFELADGAFVGSYFKYDGQAGNLVDPERVKSFMDIFRNS